MLTKKLRCVYSLFFRVTIIKLKTVCFPVTLMWTVSAPNQFVKKASSDNTPWYSYLTTSYDDMEQKERKKIWINSLKIHNPRPPYRGSSIKTDLTSVPERWWPLCREISCMVYINYHQWTSLLKLRVRVRTCTWSLNSFRFIFKATSYPTFKFTSVEKNTMVGVQLISPGSPCQQRCKWKKKNKGGSICRFYLHRIGFSLTPLRRRQVGCTYRRQNRRRERYEGWLKITK